MKLTAHIDIETEASAGDTMRAVEHAIYAALDGLEIEHAYSAGSTPITELAVTIEEGDDT